MTGTELLARQRRSQAAFFAALAEGSDGARRVALHGVQATIVPVRPWYSIFNSVVYDDPAALLDALPRLADEYQDAGSKAFAVWVVPGDELDEELSAHGLARDSTPMFMGAAIDAIDLEPRVELDLQAYPSAEAVAAVNDRAHGILPDWSMTAVFARELPGARPLVAVEHGRPVAALLSQDHDGDCYLWFVATDPEARGRGLAGELVREALRRARARGCTTTTLESTAMAESLYSRLGYRSFGRYVTWERRF